MKYFRKKTFIHLLISGYFRLENVQRESFSPVNLDYEF